MQSMEERIIYNRVVSNTSVITNSIYASFHLVYLVFFLITKVYILAYINIGSVIYYMLLFILVKRKMYSKFAIACGIEIMAYMTCATILCGFESGFHLCIIGLCVIAFYTSYFSKQKRETTFAVVWTICSNVLYIALILICCFTERYYKLDKWINTILLIVHSTIVFGFICIYLKTFTSYAVRLENAIKKESRLDELTEIPNRYALYNYLDSLDDKNNYILAIFDIDDFKRVNDKYGHICGDYILKEIARICNLNLNGSFLCRFGGEEFIIIDKYDNESINRLDNIRKVIEDNDFIFDDNNIKVTITVGAAIYSSDISNDMWINKADEKLYEGKNSGKNKTVN